jgi:type 1 glutamine amidotransferase
MKKILTLSIFFIFTFIYSQPLIQWQKTLGGTGWDTGSSIQQTADGGYIVAGLTSSNDGDVSGNKGFTDFWVVKLNSLGAIVWQKTLGGTSDEEVLSIQQTADGGYIVAGLTSSNDGDVSGNHGLFDFWVVKLNSLGAIVWQKTLGGTSYDWPSSIQQTTDGGYIVAGRTESNDGDVTGNHGGYDFWVVKLNSLGTIVWQKTLGGTLNEQGLSIQQTADGGYIVAGLTSSNDGDVSGNKGFTDFWVVKLNSLGAIVWQKSLGGTGYDWPSSIQQTADGGYIVAGSTSSNDGDVTGNHGYDDMWVVKLDSLGAIVWQKTLGGTSDEWLLSIQQTADGGYIVAGHTSSNDGDVIENYGLTDFWVVKLNSLGTIVWQKTLGGTGYDWPSSIQQTADGGYIVAGYTFSNDGDVTGSHGGYDIWVVKLSNTLGINEVPIDDLISIYPNPAINEIKVKIDANIIGSPYVIYDQLGRSVLTGKLNDENSVIDIRVLPKGIYVFSLGNNYKSIKIIKE